MKTIFRNFRTTLMRFKLSSSLNIFGLSIAFAAFIIIMIQVNYETNFDRGYQKTGRIFRLERSMDSVTYSPLFSRPMLNGYTANLPQIEDVSIVNLFGGQSYISVDKGGSREGFMEEIMRVYPGFVNIFDMEFVEGGHNALDAEDKVIIPLSMAEKLFGQGVNYMGKLITMEDKYKGEVGDGAAAKKTFEIHGVYRDFPVSSSQRNVIYGKMGDENLTQWGNSNYYCYLTLQEGVNPREVEALMVKSFDKVQIPEWAGEVSAVRLTPIEDVYYQTGTFYDVSPKGNRSVTNVLIAIAILIVTIAGINFVNFATSLTPLRIKSINTQKVLGSPTIVLRLALVMEAVGISIIGLLLGLVWVNLMDEAGFSQFLLTAIDMASNMNVVWLAVGLSVVVGLLSGIYPAFYTTSFQPALVLKGSFGMSPKGRQLRNALIGFQFVISIGLIIAALFMQLQNSFVRSYNTGTDQLQIAIVELSDDMATPDKKALIVNKLKESPLVKDVAFSQFVIGSSDNYMTWGREFRDGEDLNFNCMPVSYNFCEVLGLKIVDGRGFTQQDDLYRGGRAIFNQTAQKQFRLTLDDTFGGHTDTTAQIVGFVKDFNFKSLRVNIEPMALYLFGPEAWMNLATGYVKIEGDPYAAVDHIKKTLATIDPNYPVDVQFYDTIFNTLYQKERKTTALITVFSLLAVLISLVGVFGIVVFETQFRRKEIGLRKVYGSTINQILIMFNRKFVWIIAICFVIAAPLAYYGVTMWLEGFAFKTPIFWWVFALALLIVLFITLLTVTIQSYRAATENPVKSIKSE